MRELVLCVLLGPPVRRAGFIFGRLLLCSDLGGALRP